MRETLEDIVVNSSGFYRILLENLTHAIVLVGVLVFRWDNFQSGTPTQLGDPYRDARPIS
jgi:hypothetical protein